MKLHRPTSAPIAAGTVDATTWISYLDETGEHLGVRDADLSHMIFQIPQLIAIISELTILEAGDVILTGTPEGTGSRAQPPHFFSDGDTVTVDITGVGIIHNTVVSEAARGRWT